MAAIVCDTCGAETPNIYRRCDACLVELGNAERSAQGLGPKVTDVTALKKAATIFRLHRSSKRSAA